MSDQAPAASDGETLAPLQEMAQRLAAAEAAERRNAFLAEASRVLASSLDYETTLRNLARLAVPTVADWCAIDVLADDGRVRRVEVVHPDPEKEQLARELDERFPPAADAPHGVPRVLRTGEPELVPVITDAILQAVALGEEHLRLLRTLGLRSYLVVPLLARGRTLGAFTLIYAESGRTYGEEELRLVQELAGRAALAVDNARLYAEARAARQQNQAILESITDAFFALDRQWRFTYVNGEAELLLDRPRAELLGHGVWERFPEAVGSVFEEKYRHAVDSGRKVEFEEFYPPLERWFEVHAYPSAEGLAVYFKDITQRHQMEQALRRQSELTRTITENATSALFMMDERGHCTYLNPAAERMIGFSLAEIRDLPLHDAIHHHHPDGRPYPMAECPIDRALPENFDIRAHEDVFIRKNGEFFPVLCAASPIFEHVTHGRPIGTIIEVRDVTEERRAAAALKESEARYRFLAESIPVQIWTARPDGSLDYVTRRTAEQLGRSVAQLLGEGWQHVVHPDDLPRAAERWAHAVATGETYEVEFRLRRADAGGYRWHLSRAVPLRDAAGRIVRWFGSNTDIQDRKEAEQEGERLFRSLEAERTRLQQVFTEAPAVMALYSGPEHVVTLVNPTWERTVGKPNALGRPFREVFPEFAGSGLFEELDRVYESGEPFVDPEVNVPLERWGSGVLEDTYWHLVWRPLAGEGPEGRDILVHAVEVTEQVRARRAVEQKAEELARLARALEVTNRELDQFAYVASHDLKAPLRGIANLSQWIEEDLGGGLPPAVKEHMELLRGRVHRMEGLIDGILQYSRAGRVREKPEPVDVGALVREVVDLLAPPPGAEIAVTGAMPTLVTERLPLQQVLLNLVGNALKHAGREDPRVEVAAREAGDFWEFSVQDNGPGIAPEYHERVFTIFQTLEARDRVEGTGIGLSLVKKLVETRGGQIWLESAEGTGACFRFRWPKTAVES